MVLLQTCRSSGHRTAASGALAECARSAHGEVLGEEQRGPVEGLVGGRGEREAGAVVAAAESDGVELRVELRPGWDWQIAVGLADPAVFRLRAESLDRVVAEARAAGAPARSARSALSGAAWSGPPSPT
jgi:hypothetical protein